jgi:hypothetical protein
LSIGITFPGNEKLLYERLSLSAITNPKNKVKLPIHVVQIIHILQNAELPLCASLEVLVPRVNTVVADPILMLSCCDKFFFLLCHWSNNVG